MKPATLCLWCGRPVLQAPFGPPRLTHDEPGLRCRVALCRDRARRQPMPLVEAAGQVHLFQEPANRTSQRVAALYVNPAGPYHGLPGVDPWGLDRDASTWWGPDPAVAHPPCGPWGVYRHTCLQRADLAVRAVEQVRTWGGVLEHPAGSRLWLARELPKPGEPPDRWGGWSMLIRQSWWGHAAPKPTWLYIIGTSTTPPLPLPTPDPGGRVEGMKGDERELTPPALATWLVELARLCRCAATGEAPDVQRVGSRSPATGRAPGAVTCPVENLRKAPRRCNG